MCIILLFIYYFIAFIRQQQFSIKLRSFSFYYNPLLLLKDMRVYFISLFYLIKNIYFFRLVNRVYVFCLSFDFVILILLVLRVLCVFTLRFKFKLNCVQKPVHPLSPPIQFRLFLFLLVIKEVFLLFSCYFSIFRQLTLFNFQLIQTFVSVLFALRLFSKLTKI